MYEDWVKSQLKGALRGTKGKLAEHMGIDGPKLSKTLAGQRELSARELQRAVAFFGRAPEDLQGGLISIPLISWVSAGAMMREDVSVEALGDLVVSDLPPGDWIALKVVGDSMDRISPPESTIFVDRNDKELVPNALYVIADDQGNATYKRFRPGPPRRFEPVSVNTAHEPIIPEQDPIIVGRVKRSVLDAM